jgi:MFS family permease
VRTIGHEELNLKFGRAGSFWLLATLLALLSAASSTPSPLYAVYAARWHFSSITLTAIFGVYALALLAALLTTGRLSDHLGRRPVVLLALLVLLAGVLAFIAASGAGWLFTARILQGLGTGMAAGAISAWLVDLQPPDRPGLGAWSAVSRRSAAWRLARWGRACWYNMAPTHCTWCTGCCWPSSCSRSPPCRSCRT